MCSLIVNVIHSIIRRMAGADQMLKHTQQDVPKAKPRGGSIDIDAGYERVMKRFPRIMARLGA